MTNNLIAWIKRRLRNRNLNCILVICGSTGSGKSWTSLRIAELVDPNFSPENICFSVKEFLSLLNSRKLRKGAAVVVEEAGVIADSRQFYSLLNRTIVYIMETFRSDNLLCIFNLPNLGGLDKRARLVIHGYLEMMSIDPNRHMANVKFLESQTNPKTGKVYYKYIVIRNNHGRTAKQRVFGFLRPSKPLRKEYELKKKDFRMRLQEDLYKGIDIAEKRGKESRVVDEEAIIEKIRKAPSSYIKVFHGKVVWDKPKIERDYGIGFRRRERIISALGDPTTYEMSNTPNEGSS